MKDNENEVEETLEEIEELLKSIALTNPCTSKNFSNETPGFWDGDHDFQFWNNDGEINRIKAIFEKSLLQESNHKKNYDNLLNEKNKEINGYKSALVKLKKENKRSKIEKKRLLREKNQLKKLIDSLEEKALRTNSSLVDSSSGSDEGYLGEEKRGEEQTSTMSPKKRHRIRDFDEIELKNKFEYSPSFLKKEGFYINISPSKDSRTVTEEHKIRIQGASDYLGRKSKDYSDKIGSDLRKRNNKQGSRKRQSNHQNFQSLQEEHNFEGTGEKQKSLFEEDNRYRERHLSMNSPGLKLTDNNMTNVMDSNLDTPEKDNSMILKVQECDKGIYMITNEHGVSSAKNSRLRNFLNYSLKINPKYNIIEEGRLEESKISENNSTTRHNLSNPLYSNRNFQYNAPDNSTKQKNFKQIKRRRQSIFSKKLSNTDLWLKTAKQLEDKRRKQTLRCKKKNNGNGGLGFRTHRTIDFDRKLSYSVFDKKRCEKNNIHERHLYCEACNEGFQNLEKNLDQFRKSNRSGFLRRNKNLKSENEYFDNNSVHHPLYMTGEI